MYKAIITTDGQQVSPLGFATVTRATFAALGAPDAARLTPSRVIWLAQKVEEYAKDRFNLTTDAEAARDAILKHVGEAQRLVDFPVYTESTWDDLAALGHNTWSWNCHVPPEQRPNGDALDTFAVCPICEDAGQ